MFISIIVEWRLGQIDPIDLWIWPPVLLLFASVAWVACRRVRRRLHRIREGSIIDINLAYNPFTPWNQISSFALDPAVGDIYRLRVTKGVAFPIDAEIRLSEEKCNPFGGF